jgi:hypothetical protein
MSTSNIAIAIYHHRFVINPDHGALSSGSASACWSASFDGERLVVPDEAGQRRWREGASVEGGRKKRRRKGRLAISLAAPDLFSEVADSVTCNGLDDCVSLLREPDAANPHVRFDERGVETEAWWE